MSGSGSFGECEFGGIGTLPGEGGLIGGAVVALSSTAAMIGQHAQYPLAGQHTQYPLAGVKRDYP